MKNIKEIQEVNKEAKKKIYYLIFDSHKEEETEIKKNFNMGLISFMQYIEQIADLNKHTLKLFKDNNVTELDTQR